MEVKKVIVDSLPKDCIECPLNHGNKRDCGKDVNRNVNGGVSYGKQPDKRCKLRIK